MNIRLAALRCISIAVLGMIVGCSTTSADPEVGLHEPEGDPSFANGARSLPLETYIFTPSEQSLLAQASNRLIRNCMAKRGFDYEVTPAAAAPEVTNRLARRYGITDVAIASQWGFHLPPEQNLKGVEATPNETPDEGFMTALTGGDPPLGDTELLTRDVVGRPRGGCRGDAHRELLATGGYFSEPDLVQQLNVQGFAASSSDHRVTSALADWSDCMAGEGFTVDSPLSFPEFSGPQPTPEEVHTAQAAARCNNSSNLAARWFLVEVEYEHSFIEAHSAEFASLRAGMDDQLAIAGEVLSGRAPTTGTDHVRATEHA